MRRAVNIRATLAAILASVALSSQAIADTLRIDIPAGSLLTALETLAKQANVDLVYQDAQVQGLKTRGVSGELSAQEAVSKLVEGTPLQVKTDAVTGAILITVPGGTHSSAPGPQPATRDSEARTQIDLDEVIVTGSHIRGGGSGASPIIAYGRADIERSGASTVEQFVRQIPQNFGAVNAGTASGGTLNGDTALNTTFGSGMDLHGLGAGATLVLVNGVRVAPAGSNGSFVDVSMIPLSAVERVEILTDGASAVYGADAVGGVVNFILRRQFSGAETAVHYSDTTQGGAAQRSVSQALGGEWRSGNALLSYEYFDQDPLQDVQRDYIPSLNAPRLVLPKQRRNSAFLSAEQKLTPDISLRADVFFSDRDFSTDGSNGFATSHNEGSERLISGTLGIGAKLTADWQLDGTVSVAEQEGANDGQVRFGTVSQTTRFATRSKISSAELRANGNAFELPAGSVKISLGASARREEFDDRSIAAGNAGSGLSRDVSSVFGELLIPVISNPSARFGARRLEVSIAGRYDHYPEFGSSTNPKYGIRWTLMDGFDLRSTYGTAFRAPTLSQLSPLGAQYAAFAFASPTGPINTVYISAPGNDILQPEESESFTAGFDVKPESVPGLSLSASYYRVRYTDRIAQPPVVGSVSQIYFQQATLAPYIDFTPDSAELARIYASGRLTNPLNLPASSIRALFDNRLQNLAVSKSSGIDAQTAYSTESAYGNVAVFLNANYTFDLSYRAAPTTSSVDLLDTLFRPVDFRGRLGASWSARGFSSTWSLSYVSGYENALVTPREDISSWTTVDAQFSYQTEGSAIPALRGITVALNVQNVFDRDPPLFNPGPANPTLYRFDPVNASPLGRLITMDLRKRW